jgi:hypothetical protein
MNLKIIFADILQKRRALVGVTPISEACFNKKIDWMITGFAWLALHNTLIIGSPLLK